MNRLKEWVRPVYATGRRLIKTELHRAAQVRSHKPVVAHQGIQRSGTNFLCHLLNASGYFVLNEVDPRRDDPRHKHCRWQTDKASIQMDPRFRHDLQADTLREVNALCGYAPSTVHVVVFKDPASWLASIERWALTSRWISRPLESNCESDRALASRWLREWDAYYNAWLNFAGSDPQQVAFFSYRNLLGSPNSSLQKLSEFTGHRPDIGSPVDLLVPKVPHSSRRSSNTPESVSEWHHALVQEIVSFPWIELSRPQMNG